MPKQKLIKYPHGRPSALAAIFKLIQDEHSWNPSVVNVSTLKNLGLAPSKEAITIHTLKFLGILDEMNQPTAVYQDLRSNFQQTLAKQVRESYNAIFDQIPVSRINQTTLVNFFVNAGLVEDTAEYQGSLFVFLCKTANIDLPNASSSFKRSRFKKKNKKTNV